MKTWTMCDRGYDCDRTGPYWDCTADSFSEAAAMCLEVSRVSFCQPINDVRGCSTFAAYVPSPTGGHAKIGCVHVRQVQPA